MREVKRYILWCIKGIRRKVKKMSPAQKRLAWTVFLTLTVGCILGSCIGKMIEKKRSEEKVKQAVAKVQKKADEEFSKVEQQLYTLQDELYDHSEPKPWNLTLVNSAHPMGEGYVPELAELLDGYSVDKRILDAARKMLSDAEEEGLQVKVCSAYRSVERQEQLFGQAMKERVQDGMEYWDAYEDTVSYIALPGTSEHALGLALDLVSNEYTELNEKQEETKEAKWLKENCYKYGFILRYPPNKTNITKITYEPWHYRYVGEEHASKIMELGITLEEYIQEHYQSEEGEQ